MENDARTYAIIGAAMRVHRQLGPGFLGAVYQEALGLEFRAQAVPAQEQVALPVWYGAARLKQTYRADFISHGEIIVELKAVASIGRTEVAQLANYLTATKLPLGLLLNFGSTELQFIRVIGRHAEPQIQTRERLLAAKEGS
jgi:GxxExxY protein